MRNELMHGSGGIWEGRAASNRQHYPSLILLKGA